MDLPLASDPPAQHPCSPPRSGLLHCPLSSGSAGVSEVLAPRLPGTRSPDTLWTLVSWPPSFWPRGLPLCPPRPSCFLSLPGPCPTLALPPSPICLSAPLSVPVSVALSLSIQLSVTPSALPCSPPLSPLSLLEVSPSVPPPRPLPRAPCPSTLTDSAGVLSYGLVQAKFSILLAFFPLWLM